MSDLLPQLIVLALGGAIAPPLLLLTSLFWDSRRPLPNATTLWLGYYAVLRGDGYLRANPLRRGGDRSEGSRAREEVTQEVTQERER